MINLKTLLKELYLERYAGAKQERGIWYHGTSMKKVPTILSRGLLPDIPKKQKSWGDDPHVDLINLDKTSYGGVYVTQNLGTATSSALRVSRQDKSNEALVIMELQPRSLVADEDDFAYRLMNLKPHLHGSVYHSIYPYMWETYGSSDDYKEWANKYKKEWVESSLDSLFYEFKLINPTFRRVVEKLLYDEGYKAMLTRTVSYLDKKHSHTDYWEWRKAYADVHGMRDYGEEENIPDPPSSAQGEKQYRDFIDKITKLMKSKARHNFTGSFSKTARSLNPIGFIGSNRIISVVEIVPSQRDKYSDDIKILYGSIPEDFKIQWNEKKGKLNIINN